MAFVWVTAVVIQTLDNKATVQLLAFVMKIFSQNKSTSDVSRKSICHALRSFSSLLSWGK